MSDTTKTVSIAITSPPEYDDGQATVTGVSGSDYGDGYRTVTIEGVLGIGVHFELTCSVAVLDYARGWMGDALRYGWQLVRKELERD